jgi:hypothetical protein
MMIRNQKVFPEYMYDSLRALCRAGGLGNMEALILFAFRDEDNQVYAGM